ncbi:unnamed protein product, partial [Heterosigma akashiwo]
MNRRRSIRASIKLSDFRVANDNIRATNASRLQEHSFSPAPLSPVGEKNEDPFAGLLDDEIEFLKFYIFRAKAPDGRAEAGGLADLVG